MIDPQGTAFSLNHIAVLSVKGSDARKYLQSQFTQDIGLLSSSQGMYGAVLTPQGKTVADARLIQLDEHTLWMLHEQAVSESLLRRMRMFALGHNVAITLLPMVVEAYDGDAMGALWPAIDQSPSLATKVVKDAIFLVHADFMAGCWRIAKEASPLASQDATEYYYTQRRVCKGIPRFTVDWHAGDYPLNANLREFRGISFDKGCYVGQEINSRMHWRNGVRHALYHVGLSALPAIHPCDLVTTVAIGYLSSCVAQDDNRVYGIARLPVTIMDEDAVDRRNILRTVDGITVTVLKKTDQS